MFDHEELAQIIGYNDAYLEEPSHVWDFPEHLRWHYMKGRLGQRYGEVRKARKQLRRTWLDLFFLGSR